MNAPRAFAARWVLYTRLRDAWDIGRVTKNIRYNIDSAIAQADVIRDGEFLLLPGNGAVVTGITRGGSDLAVGRDLATRDRADRIGKCRVAILRPAPCSA